MKKIALSLALILTFTFAFANYSDTDSHWAKAEIQWATDKNIVNGYPDGLFLPDNTITRAESLKPITILFDIKSDEKDFSDVKKDEWYYTYINDGWSVMPQSGNNFYPDEEITRQDAIYAVIKAKFNDATPKDVDSLKLFKDNYLISDYARPYIAYAYEAGIVEGYEDNTLKPNATLTRAEFVKLLKYAYEYKEQEFVPDTPDIPEEEKVLSNFVPILSTSLVANNNGVEVLQLNGLKFNETVELITSESFSDEIFPGDVVIPQYALKDYVKYCNKLSSIKDGTVTFGSEYMSGINAKGKKTKYYFGEIAEIERTTNIILKDNDASKGSYGKDFSIDFDTELYFYNTMAKEQQRLYLDSIDSLVYEEGKFYIGKDEATKAFIVAREYDDEMREAMIYIIK